MYVCQPENWKRGATGISLVPLLCHITYIYIYIHIYINYIDILHIYIVHLSVRYVYLLDVSHVSSQINSKLLQMSDWLTVNKWSRNVENHKYMIFHNNQRVVANKNIPDLQVNDKKIERVSCLKFLGLTTNKFMNCSSHSTKIVNKISRTIGIMNRLKRNWTSHFQPWNSFMILWFLSHLHFGITCWGFEWNKIFKLQKRDLRIMTNSEQRP